MSESETRETLQPKTWFDKKLQKSQFIPKNEGEYRKMLTKAMREHPLKELTETSADGERYKYYENLYTTCKKILKQSEIDLRDPENLKVYLACRKICKRGFEIVADTRLGLFDERSPLLGADSKTFYEFVKKVTSNKELEQLYRNFYSLIYDANNGVYKMIPIKDREQAEKIAKEIYKQKLEEYEVNPESVIFDEDSSLDFQGTATYTYDADDNYNDWTLHVVIYTQQLDGHDESKYCALFVVKSHELGHVMQTTPGINELLTDKLIGFLTELAPTIETIVLQDEIYKTIHKIPLKEKINYNTKICLGDIANRFRELKQELGCRSFEEVLLYDARMHKSEVIREILDICMTKEEQDKRSESEFEFGSEPEFGSENLIENMQQRIQYYIYKIISCKESKVSEYKQRDLFDNIQCQRRLARSMFRIISLSEVVKMQEELIEQALESKKLSENKREVLENLKKRLQSPQQFSENLSSSPSSQEISSSENSSAQTPSSPLSQEISSFEKRSESKDKGSQEYRKCCVIM